VVLKVVLAVVGCFLALSYPLMMFVRQDPSVSMFSIYVTLGVFPLLAIRNPSANRSMIAFTAWSSFAHGAVMGTQAMRNMISPSSAGRSGCSRRRRRKLDHAGTGETASRSAGTQ
jgi:hypothetical protein